MGAHTKKGAGRKSTHAWDKLKLEYIEARILNHDYSLADFAVEKKMSYATLRNMSSRQDWNAAYINMRTKIDEEVTNQTLERHGKVLERMRKRLIFTEEHIRVRTATFTGTIRTKIEESLLAVDWDKVTIKDRREMYALMREIEWAALGIHAAKHNVHWHVNTPQLQGPNGQKYLPPDASEEMLRRRRSIAEKFFQVIEGKAKRLKEGQS